MFNINSEKRMSSPIVFDISRLATRVWNRTPNGIDRIDYAFASHFINSHRFSSAGVTLTLFGPRVVSPWHTREILSNLARHWGEDENEVAPDDIFPKIVDWIARSHHDRSSVMRISSSRRRRGRNIWDWSKRLAQPSGGALKNAVPRGAVYLNVSQFPLWISTYFRWLSYRPDVKSIFFIHDLLPLEVPEYFRPAEYERHRKRLRNLAAFGTGAIVTSQITRVALQHHLSEIGRTDLPILVAPIPAAPIFSRLPTFEPALAAQRYFVMCGTIEPRKNHLLLLNVWRELVRRRGSAAPKLILVGTRGWENENVVDMLERSRTISNHVLEISGLSTLGFKRLLDGSCGLLMPSFAEGYGLPVVEALAANVPVVASDLSVFASTDTDQLIRVSPLDGEKWLETINQLSYRAPKERFSLSGQMERYPDEEWRNYFAKIEEFLAKL